MGFIRMNDLVDAGMSGSKSALFAATVNATNTALKDAATANDISKFRCAIADWWKGNQVGFTSYATAEEVNKWFSRADVVAATTELWNGIKSGAVTDPWNQGVSKFPLNQFPVAGNAQPTSGEYKPGSQCPVQAAPPPTPLPLPGTTATQPTYQAPAPQPAPSPTTYTPPTYTAPVYTPPPAPAPAPAPAPYYQPQQIAPTYPGPQDIYSAPPSTTTTTPVSAPVPADDGNKKLIMFGVLGVGAIALLMFATRRQEPQYYPQYGPPGPAPAPMGARQNTKTKKTYKFFWSPEGRCVATYRAESRAAAKAMFKKEHRKSYAKYMGEVYIEEVE